jgi:beta-lactamase regulating signal transducer with metallopeptidase domain/WD40 repeat protein
MDQVINSCVTALNSIGSGFCSYTTGIFVQSSVLIVLLLLIDFLLRKRVRAVFRYCVWMLVFVKLILPPTLSLPTGIGYWYGDYLSADSPVLQQVSNVVRPEYAGALAPEDFALAAEIPQGQPSQTNPQIAAPVTSAVSGLNALTWQAFVFLLWLVGVLVISVLLIQRMSFVKRLIAQSEPAKNRLLDMLNQCRRKVGIGRNMDIRQGRTSNRRIELRLSNNVSSPAVCGLFKPVILIPTALLEKLSPDKLRAVLVHELVHIKRADIWVNLVQTVLQIIYFYNPFVWLANAVVRRVREQAVDEMVLVALGAGAKSYSNTLIDIAEMAFWKTSLSLRLIGVVESKKALQRRIRHMLNRPIPKNARVGVLGTIVIIVIAAALLPMAKAQKSNVADATTKPEAVSTTRARLAALGQQEGEEGPILRRVYSGYIGYPGNLSHDGKLAAITDWKTGGNLAVRDLTSGEVRRLTNKNPLSESNGSAYESIFSPDDKQIAYVWLPHERQNQLRIISADGTGQRILYPRNEENKKDGGFLWPIDWSPDGERILCTWHKQGHKNRVMLLSVGDSSLRELELPEFGGKFSPDGRHLTLDARPAKDAGRDIFLLSLEDGSRTPLVEHPADDYLLGWSPDGNYLVFASDRTGDPGIWVLRVDQGKPVGKPMLVKTQMGDFDRVGMMRDGAYYFTTESGERWNVFTAGFDPETGKVTPASKALLPYAKLNRSMADWLPGADEIAYLEWGDEGGIKIRKIMVHSLKTGATREIVTKPKIKGYNYYSLAVCPTGHWLAVWGYIEDGLKWRVLLIDLETNELTEVKQPGNFVNVHWSKDGRWLYFGGFLPGESRDALFRRDMQTGKVTELFDPPSKFGSWTISPDGQQIAYSGSKPGAIKVIPVTGGEPRVVAKVKNASSMFWTPDGRYLVYAQGDQLWRVAAEGGEPEAISPRMRIYGHLQIHPDGQRILFSGKRHPSKYELWALENFLPTEWASGR